MCVYIYIYDKRLYIYISRDACACVEGADWLLKIICVYICMIIHVYIYIYIYDTLLYMMIYVCIYMIRFIYINTLYMYKLCLCVCMYTVQYMLQDSPILTATHLGRFCETAPGRGADLSRPCMPAEGLRV